MSMDEYWDSSQGNYVMENDGGEESQNLKIYNKVK